MSNNQNDLQEQNTDNRRSFLTKSAMLLATLSLGGINVQAQDGLSTEQVKALRSVVDSGIKSGNIKSALKENGSVLPRSLQQSLGKLTSSDLRAIANLRRKINVADVAADNNGVVIM